jgi:lysophospholipase L1-like esterase
LACYAEATPGVEYFGACDDIFAYPNRTTMHLPDDLHPDEEGHQLWGEAILDRLSEILDFETNDDNSKG